MSESPDIPAALAKMGATALTADLATTTGVGELLVALFYLDRVHAAGFLTGVAEQWLGKLEEAIRVTTGLDFKPGREYLWTLACTYGRMATHASTPSKQDIIYHAFFSEFSEEFANDADNAIFRELVETLDYNEAVFLAGVWALKQNTKRSPSSPDYHVARRLLARGELYVAVVKEDGDNVKIIPTQALGKFVRFIKIKGVAPKVR
ncbi:MAG: hypothetical protein ACPG4T_00765 [Nannocystaceae bacterium]